MGRGCKRACQGFCARISRFRPVLTCSSVRVSHVRSETGPTRWARGLLVAGGSCRTACLLSPRVSLKQGGGCAPQSWVLACGPRLPCPPGFLAILCDACRHLPCVLVCAQAVPLIVNAVRCVAPRCSSWLRVCAVRFRGLARSSCDCLCLFQLLQAAKWY